MKTTLLLAALTAVRFTTLAQTAQTTPSPTAPVTMPSHIDPTRFHQFDANKDGKLDLQEQAAERASRPAWEAEKRARATAFRQEREQRQRQFDLERFDANKDGILDTSEQKARDQHYETLRQEFIKKHDNNGNGKIDPDEIHLANPLKPAP